MSTPDQQGPPRDARSSVDRGPAPTLLPRGVMPTDPQPDPTPALLDYVTGGAIAGATSTRRSRKLVHLRIDEEYLTRLDQLVARLPIGSRVAAINLGMPVLLDYLENVAFAIENAIDTVEKK